MAAARWVCRDGLIDDGGHEKAANFSRDVDGEPLLALRQACSVCHTCLLMFAATHTTVLFLKAFSRLFWPCVSVLQANAHPQTKILIDLEKSTAKALYAAPDTLNTITYTCGVATFSNPTGKLYDINAGTDMNGDLCYQVSNVPAVKNGVPTDDAGNAITSV